MGFTKRRLATGKQITDRSLILGWIAGEFSDEDELDQAAGDNWFSFALFTGWTKLGRLGYDLWREYGPDALRDCGDELPHHLRQMLDAFHSLSGEFDHFDQMLNAEKERERAELSAEAAEILRGIGK